MATAIRMPDVGTNVDTIVVVSWLKAVGDAVKVGEPLCEIETDKASTELECVAEGILLRQVAPPGAEVEEGEIIAYVGAVGETIAEEDANPTVPASAPVAEAPHRRESAGSEAIPVSPLLRNLAHRLHVDLSTVKGTGPDGRITREDILRAGGAA